METKQNEGITTAVFSPEGLLLCGCGSEQPPVLTEHGYTVEHEFVGVEGKEIKARGWDGGSKGVSEGGTHYTLDCGACFKEHALPADMEIAWQ